MRKSDRSQINEINVVPYVDVMLVLLVVFMVTAPLLVQGIKIDLPETTASVLDESELEELVAVGAQAFTVAMAGVILPFAFGTFGLIYLSIFTPTQISYVLIGALFILYLLAYFISIKLKVLT